MGRRSDIKPLPPLETANGTSIRLGRFKSLEIATTVITQARLKAHGEFARMA